MDAGATFASPTCKQLILRDDLEPSAHSFLPRHATFFYKNIVWTLTLFFYQIYCKCVLPFRPLLVVPGADLLPASTPPIFTTTV